MTIISIGQPSHITTKQAVTQVAESDEFEAMDVAAAYITSSGLFDLREALDEPFNLSDEARQKRWLTSFDYLRTEPVALETLLALPNSAVRIHVPEVVLKNKGMPKTPFHPKAFLFRRGEDIEFCLAGSGNLSRSGLSKGVEAGLAIGVDRSDAATDPQAIEAVNASRAWFEHFWNASSHLNAALLGRYTKLYEAAENLRNPPATEDDTANSDSSREAISAEDLKKLRACRNFWIDAGNVTKNRGKHLPGNQVMMKRMSRVFFGFETKNLPKDSPVGVVELSYDGSAFGDYSLTFSNNGMEKLILPVPDNGGPVSYDNKILHFRAVAPRRFELRVLPKGQIGQFRKRSKAVDGAFKMKGGREWGVF